VCPVEIVFDILGKILWSGVELTHQSFCALNKLMKTNNKVLGQLVKNWMMGRKVRDYISDRVSNQWCLNPSSAVSESMIWQLLVNEEPFNACNDLITGIIRDDCVDCYNLLHELMSEEDKFPDNMMACLNERGWTFFSLAVHARADKILHGHRIACACKQDLDKMD
jgi:hypothetical protein